MKLFLYHMYVLAQKYCVSCHMYIKELLVNALSANFFQNKNSTLGVFQKVKPCR